MRRFILHLSQVLVDERNAQGAMGGRSLSLLNSRVSDVSGVYSSINSSYGIP